MVWTGRDPTETSSGEVFTRTLDGTGKPVDTSPTSLDVSRDDANPFSYERIQPLAVAPPSSGQPSWSLVMRRIDGFVCPPQVPICPEFSTGLEGRDL